MSCRVTLLGVLVWKLVLIIVFVRYFDLRYNTEIEFDIVTRYLVIMLYSGSCVVRFRQFCN